jgi:uncharacterized protein YqgC (DUF456 family)
MADILPLLLLLAAFVGGLVLVPFGLPGLWVMVLAVTGYGWWTGFRAVGLATMAIVILLAAVGEALELWTGFRLARRYGGSTRAGWGAIAGGIVGAIVGVPVPLVGSVIGAFAGAFLGAALLEYTFSYNVAGAASAGWGAVLGRAAAAALKVGLGLAIAVVSLFAILRGA